MSAAEMQAKLDREKKLVDIFGEVRLERNKQDEQWGGPSHDDSHDLYDWREYMYAQLDRAAQARSFNKPSEVRERLIKVAALAVAAIESLDRTVPR